ncbi:MAG: TetR/AcrR family transcriptional regulator [Bacillota bacterium]
MPRQTRTPEEIREVKNKILEAALQSLVEEGFDRFSMRRLASRLGMTAANIYNYYTNKDELYIDIQTRGFEMLYDSIKEACDAAGDPVEKLEKMIWAYIEFGVNNSGYYNIMFSWNTPKYSDYIGTPLEQTSYLEKQTALKTAELAMEVIAGILSDRGLDTGEALYLTIKAWVTLNGLVSLINSRVLQEVDQNVEAVKQRISEDLLAVLK